MLGATGRPIGYQHIALSAGSSGLTLPTAWATSIAIASMSWASTSGGQLTIGTAAAPALVGAGSEVAISGATNTGTGGNNAANGNFVVFSVTNSTTFVLTAPAASGVYGTLGGNPVITLPPFRGVKGALIAIGGTGPVYYRDDGTAPTGTGATAGVSLATGTIMWYGGNFTAIQFYSSSGTVDVAYYG